MDATGSARPVHNAAMGLSSLQLDAFYAAAKAKNFSRAAKELFITQSALTQRISNLEAELNLSLFVRKPRGVEPTEAGQRLLRYCQARDALESELVGLLAAGEMDGKLTGAVRIAGYSSVVRSVVLPALAPLVRHHPGLQLHAQNAEMRDLPSMLLSGEVDFVIVDHELSQAGVEVVVLGEEVNVLVEGREHAPVEDVYLDHDPDDPTTARFLRAQSRPIASFRRAYVDEIYALLDGVAMGLGRGVAPRHLVRADPRLRELDGLEPMRSPVVLHFFRQSFYSRVQQAVVDQLKDNSLKLLS
jgi:DNA-binding transcriptional LysR family regulator